MATKKLTNIQEATDFVRGCTFYATGGGGLPENGIESLMSEINEKGFVQITDISEIPDDAVAVCPFLMGSIAPHDEATLKEMAGFGFIDGVNKEKARLAKAIQELEAYTGVKTTVVVPIELAGANTSGPISAGSSLGMMAVDGDYCGRAIPEILQITPYLYDRKWLPVASVDEWDNVCIIKKATNLRVVERIGKLIIAGAYGFAHLLHPPGLPHLRICPGHLQAMLGVPVSNPIPWPDRHRQQHSFPLSGHPAAGGAAVLAGLSHVRQPLVGGAAAGRVCAGAAVAAVFYRFGDFQ